MININTYIVEKLRINKDIKLKNEDKNYLVSEISYHIKHCLEDDYQRYQYKITFVDEQKCFTKDPEKTWYVAVEFNSFNKKTMNNITKSLQIRLKNILDKENIQYYPVPYGRSIYKFFLYDPE